MSLTFLRTCALALPLLASNAGGQQVTDIQPPVATVGDVVRVFGDALGEKPRLVLVVDGAAAKKTRLKVVGSGSGAGEGSSDDWVDVEVRKGFVGAFGVGVKQGKAVVGTSAGTLELVPPDVQEVLPGTAAPKDSVEVLVARYGKGKHVAFVGTTRVKITGEEEADEGLTRITIRVPKLPDGVWPVSIRNGVGLGTLKRALEITGSTKPVGKPGATVGFVNAGPGKKTKPFKAKANKVATDEQPGPETNVGAVAGKKKKPIIFGVSMDTTIADLAAGDSFAGDAGLLIYSTTSGPDQAECTWTTSANLEGEDYSIDVVSIDDERMVLFVCGKLRRALGDCGPEVHCILGTIIAPSQPAEDPGNGTGCDPETLAEGSATGTFVSDPAKDQALYGLTPGQLRFATGTPDGAGGVPDQVLTWSVSFNPATDATPATFDSLALDGSGLTQFSLELADATFWNATFAPQAPPTPSSMSVTISSVDPVPDNPFGILGCIRGSFTGTLTESSVDMPTQGFSGTFVIPWYDTGFGG